ncbi:hypothetical protein GGI23_000583 [Coemansia sp. RSA 2559]|nr:hypothetical protein GGI23_000583 [Coemansia sp. RSA 2559]KAJ2869143.1 hypothetical protein GGI22_000442 [Coemansia erecta]
MARTYGSPFETNVLVKCQRNGKVVKSFFVHELAPNCEIHELRSRADEMGVPFDMNWEMVKVLPNGSFVVLKDRKRFSDYHIGCWDSIYVRPASECAAYPPNIVQKISKFGLKMLGIKRIESRTSMSVPVSPVSGSSGMVQVNAAKRISPSALNLRQYKEKCMSSSSLLSTLSDHNH